MNNRRIHKKNDSLLINGCLFLAVFFATAYLTDKVIFCALSGLCFLLLLGAIKKLFTPSKGDVDSYSHLSEETPKKRYIYRQKVPRFHPEYTSLKLKDYWINKKDKARDCKKDLMYRARFQGLVWRHFDHSCVGCGRRSNLEMDHFFIPKSWGGCFFMKRKDGFIVNNCIPLCSICNTEKGAAPAWKFFNEEGMDWLLTENKKISMLLNEKLN